MNAYLKRIREIINAKGISDAKFADSCQVHQSAFSSMVTRDSIPKSDLLGKIVKVYNISPEWLLTGEGDMFRSEGAAPPPAVAGSARIPLLRQTVSCGPGQEWQDGDNIEGFIEPLGLSSAGRNLYAFRSRGVSMAGAGIQDGDLLIFDGSTGGPPPTDDIYVFSLDGEVYCKLLVFEPIGGLVQIHSMKESDNVQAAELLRTVDPAAAGLQVFGRVVGWVHENRLMWR